MHSEFRQMAKSSKDFAFKTTFGEKDLEIDLTGLKCTMKEKFRREIKNFPFVCELQEPALLSTLLYYDVWSQYPTSPFIEAFQMFRS